ncbi:hypothetical protein OTU49_001660 [Cherax quadricarinatus]|uniref:Uncharacterized protein n=1 Tax=Cherax quadricarinatus TaxID=27406 RepID=A0AAW0XE21_CHEQU|nr:uncharacterized protein LOC128691138 [Cherax quadricarinatus]
MHVGQCSISPWMAQCPSLLPWYSLWPLILLTILHSVVSLPQLYPINGRTVKLNEGEIILCHAERDYLKFTLISSKKDCWLNEYYGVNASKVAGRNPQLEDRKGQQWYELSFFTSEFSFWVKISGETTHLIQRRWSAAAKCREKVFTLSFVNPKTILSSYSPTLTVSSPLENNRKNLIQLNIDRIIRKLDFFETLTDKEKKYVNNDLGTSHSHRLVTDDLLVVVALFIPVLGLLWCLRFILYPRNKTLQYVRRVRITRMIPMPVSESDTLSVHMDRPSTHQQDPPPAYDDITQTAPPPSYSEAQHIQMVLDEASLAQMNTDHISPVRSDIFDESQSNLDSNSFETSFTPPNFANVEADEDFSTERLAAPFLLSDLANTPVASVEGTGEDSPLRSLAATFPSSNTTTTPAAGEGSFTEGLAASFPSSGATNTQTADDTYLLKSQDHVEH